MWFHYFATVFAVARCLSRAPAPTSASKPCYHRPSDRQPLRPSTGEMHCRTGGFCASTSPQLAPQFCPSRHLSSIPCGFVYGMVV
eukprot:8289545-Pyramimonas_sp.AAC.2